MILFKVSFVSKNLTKQPVQDSEEKKINISEITGLAREVLSETKQYIQFFIAAVNRSDKPRKLLPEVGIRY